MGKSIFLRQNRPSKAIYHISGMETLGGEEEDLLLITGVYDRRLALMNLTLLERVERLERDLKSTCNLLQKTKAELEYVQVLSGIDISEGDENEV